MNLSIIKSKLVSLSHFHTGYSPNQEDNRIKEIAEILDGLVAAIEDIEDKIKELESKVVK